MDELCRKIVVVGGGSAGWLLASRLAKKLNVKDNAAFSVTVIESPDVNIVGVGEGTWPTMRQTLRKIGVKETDFMRECCAAFKQGTKFVGWRDGGDQDFYYHPFDAPGGSNSYNAGDLWHKYKRPYSPDSFCAAVSPQYYSCEQGLAPKTITHGEYQGFLNYAYHLDAVKLVAFLRRHATENLGIRLIEGNVLGVQKDENGWIDHLITKEHGNLEGDLFFDCTGFNALLMHQNMDVPYSRLDDTLFVDRALVMQVPYDHETAPLASTTISTAHDAGWIWDIGLSDRRGVGFVYSSNHMNDEEALAGLRQYVGHKASSLPDRQIKFQARRLDRFWEKNVIAVGLAAGFVEPLEAAAIMMIETTADWFCERFPSSRHVMTLQSRIYNETFLGYWDRIVQFIKFHYVLSKRTTDFWKDNKRESSIPQDLLEKLKLWQYCAPFSQDFLADSYVFSWQSFQYVYFGMGSSYDSASRNEYPEERVAFLKDFDRTKAMTKKALETLPSNRELLMKIRDFGLQQV